MKLGVLNWLTIQIQIVFVATLIHKTEPGCQTSGCTSQNHNIRETIHPSDTDVENVDPLPPNDANDARWPGSWSVLEKFKKKAAWKLLPVVNLTALCMSFGELWNLEITRANKQTLFRNFQYNLNYFAAHCTLESHFIIGQGTYKILKFRLYWISMQK